MTQIRAFVGHGFTVADETVVATFVEYFDQNKGALPDFDWVRARAAEPIQLAAKVLKLSEGKNVFIGICTKRERVVPDEKLRPTLFNASRKSVADSDLAWKTSDWIIQEIGLAVGRGMTIVLLVENGCRKPGGLQGDVEVIPFDRVAPERAFGRLLEMMKALSPRPGAGETMSANSAETTEDEIETPSVEEDDNPNDSWDVEKYENAYVWKLISRDSPGAAKIDAAFMVSKHASEPQRLVVWKARVELWKIRFSEEGSLTRLREFQQEFPDNPELSTALANGFAALTMHSEAAKQYASAADLIIDNHEESERLRGLAAVQLSKAGAWAECDQLLKQQRSSLNIDSRSEEMNYLSRIKEITADKEDRYAEIEILERIVELSPDDWTSRFNLAYKYSELKMNDMSLYHYSQIPFSQRTPITWNNLGVAYQDFSLSSKSVEAYRNASSKGETLAMSNLAYKLMQGGFIPEADKELQRALKIPDFHRNIGEAVAALKDIPDEEDKKLREALKRVEPKRHFFQEVGKAITRPDLASLPALWTGPKCELNLKIESGELYASGEYDRVTGGALSGLLSSSARKTTRYNVQYKGKIVGRRIVGTVTEKAQDESPNSSLLGGLSGDGDETEFCMVVKEDGREISVAERSHLLHQIFMPYR